MNFFKKLVYKDHDTIEARNLFLHSIEVGDHKKIRDLLDKKQITNLNFLHTEFPSTSYFHSSQSLDIYEVSPLMAAVRSSCLHRESPGIVKLLIMYGADPNMKVQHETPLHRACYREVHQQNSLKKEDLIEMVKLLIMTGTDVNSVDYNGWSCLHFASTGLPVKELATILIEAGVDPHIRNSEEQTAKERLIEVVTSERLDIVDPEVSYDDESDTGEDSKNASFIKEAEREFLDALESSIEQHRTALQQTLLSQTPTNHFPLDIVALISFYVI